MTSRCRSSLDVVITIQHPAHVHFFRNIIKGLKSAGHDIWLFARHKDVTEELLQAYDLPYTILAGEAESLSQLVGMQLQYEWRLYRAARQINPDVMMSIGGVAVSHVAPLVGAKSIIFIDNEDVMSNYASTPFADVVCTPQRFESDYGEKHVRYPGYHELAYLHPDEFEPNLTLLAAHGVDPDDRFCVVRFVGWNAHHDVGEGGFSADGRRRLISRLAEHGQVYITSESPLPAWFDKFRLPVSADVIHDLLYYANVYIGDSQTMATEASVLGTPAIRSNSFAEGSDMSNFRELEQRYDLLFSTSDEIEATEQAVRWFRNPHSKSKWNQKRRALIEDKINVTQFVIELVDNEVTKEVVVA